MLEVLEDLADEALWHVYTCEGRQFGLETLLHRHYDFACRCSWLLLGDHDEALAMSRRAFVALINTAPRRNQAFLPWWLGRIFDLAGREEVRASVGAWGALLSVPLKWRGVLAVDACEAFDELEVRRRLGYRSWELEAARLGALRVFGRALGVSDRAILRERLADLAEETLLFYPKPTVSSLEKEAARALASVFLAHAGSYFEEFS